MLYRSKSTRHVAICESSSKYQKNYPTSMKIIQIYTMPGFVAAYSINEN